MSRRIIDLGDKHPFMRNKKKENPNYHTTYWNISVRKIRRTVDIKGESTVNGSKCIMERISPWPRTVTIPPSKICTTGTTSKSFGIPVIENDARAWVLHKRTVDEKVIRSVTEGATAIGTVTGQMGETSAEGAVVSDTAILGMARSPLATAGTFVLRTVDMEMACGMALKTTSCCIRNGFWAQAGITRCNSCWIGGCATLVKGRPSVSRNVRRNIKQRSGGRLRRGDGIV